ncbi:hypothetical protein SAMN02745824_3385 [Parasphingorhabdus marina DSM 22363]|uniref:DUF4139 domain-containing protein n=1 Tax=Parasphingorhabdus marina DSM 22363 TaxID=1123272 RepID=A0A1N6HP23_9SPHN|nr:DUF4139 domain-containing protein [Parasphingorhabdus marina]SIO21456.1 hypothetical protein SAMN02745824_3385 [Parasphingorhabdus marina DSM 22363]
MRLLAFTGLALVLATTPAVSQSSGPGDISVTIYNNNLALVQDTRRLNIPSGRSVQTFPGVSGQIRAETVGFSAANAGIVEQNFDYDLLSPAKLMEKAVGETVTIVRINPATGQEKRERAKVLAANGGVVLQIGSRIEVLRDDRLPTRVIFDKVPSNLRARPTLSVTLNSSRGGVRPAQLSYLTSGMGWKADYVALFDENAGRMDVQGWVTLTNNTGTTFDNAKTLLVAGTPSVNGQRRNNRRNNIRRAGTESANRESLGDFYLYPLAARTTIANAQTKQVSFLDVTGAPAQKAYEYTNRWLGTQSEAQSANTVLQFSSSSDGGLGDALPAGTVRVYMKDASGQPQFIGENSIGHTPMGSELGLKTGEAFDVKVKPTVTERRRLSSRKWRTTMSYELSNARPAPVTISLIQDGLDFYWSDTRIVSESMASERRSSNSIAWKVPVPANGRATVTATFETRF